jgi:hypothetical protein
MSNLVQMFAVRMYLPFSHVHLELSDSNRYLAVHAERIQQGISSLLAVFISGKDARVVPLRMFKVQYVVDP